MGKLCQSAPSTRTAATPRPKRSSSVALTPHDTDSATVGRTDEGTHRSRCPSQIRAKSQAVRQRRSLVEKAPRSFARRIPRRVKIEPADQLRRTEKHERQLSGAHVPVERMNRDSRTALIYDVSLDHLDVRVTRIGTRFRWRPDPDRADMAASRLRILRVQSRRSEPLAPAAATRRRRGRHRC